MIHSLWNYDSFYHLRTKILYIKSHFTDKRRRYFPKITRKKMATQTVHIRVFFKSENIDYINTLCYSQATSYFIFFIKTIFALGILIQSRVFSLWMIEEFTERICRSVQRDRNFPTNWLCSSKGTRNRRVCIQRLMNMDEGNTSVRTVISGINCFCLVL